MPVRASAEVQAKIDELVAKADALKTKADASDPGLSPEELTSLQEILSALEPLLQEKQEAEATEEVARIKAKLAQPTRPAVQPTPTVRTNKSDDFTHAHAFRDWIASHTSEADTSQAAYARCAKYGYKLGAPSCKVAVDYTNVNFKRRTQTRILSKGGVGLGKEYIPQTYSDKVIEELTYASPFVGVLGSESTSDGNKRSYFKFDDTDLMSTYITASGGSETNPTIPDVNVTTASQDISTFDITSGYHKVTFQALRDSAVPLEDKIAKAVANAHARRIENDVINGTGDGNTGVQGLLQVDHSVGSVSEADLGEEFLEELYWAMPQPYRENMVFLYSDSTAAKLRTALKDTTGRSLFDKNIVDGVEWPVLLGKRCYTSVYMPDDIILAFDPDKYMLRLVNGQEYAVLKERFFPHTAICGLMSFGGAWLGGTGAGGQIHSLTIGS